MDGDLAKIKVVGQYMIEVWKAVGMDLSKVEVSSRRRAARAQPRPVTKCFYGVTSRINQPTPLSTARTIPALLRPWANAPPTLTPSPSRHAAASATTPSLPPSPLLQFLWASDEINAAPAEYWTLVMDIAMKNNLKRVVRCSQIMGRNETDELAASQIFYPVMQCADIFFLKADICQLGMDQRKVNMLAREYCDLCKPKRKFKPVILSHQMMPGLKQGQEKMSKSDPDSAIFMEDSEADVMTKIKKAYCPPNEVEGNPILDYVRLVVFPWFGKFTVNVKDVGPKEYTSMETLEEDFKSGVVHPSDLKPATAAAINEILQPVRDHFVNDPKAKELLKKVKGFKVTR